MVDLALTLYIHAYYKCLAARSISHRSWFVYSSLPFAQVKISGSSSVAKKDKEAALASSGNATAGGAGGDNAAAAARDAAPSEEAVEVEKSVDRSVSLVGDR